MAGKEGQKKIALLIVGRTGNGKSSTGNTILQYAPLPSDVTRQPDKPTGMFSVTHGFNTDTQTCESATCHRGQLEIKVINTPDLTSRDMDSKETKISPDKEMGIWGSEIKGNDCTVLLVITCDKRYTADEFAVYQQIKDSKRFTNSNLVVVFTKGDLLNGRDLRTNFVDTSVQLQEVLMDAGWRYVVFENKPRDAANGDRSKAACVRTLLDIVDKELPHPFTQQICRLLVTGSDVDKINLFVKAILEGTRTQSQSPNPKESGCPVRFLCGTTQDGLRLEVTVCTDGNLKNHSQTVQCALSPGPHAILRVNKNSHGNNDLGKALGKQGDLVIQSAEGNLQLDLSDFIVDISSTDDWKFTDILEKVKAVARLSLFMSEDMKNQAEKVQAKIDDTQATYDTYLKVKGKMVHDSLAGALERK